MLSKVKKPGLTITITIYMILFFIAPGIAGMIESSYHSGDMVFSKEIRQEKVQTIQRALENKMVQEKLKAHGLNSQEINEKLKSCSDEQIHMLAQASEKLLAGGDSLSLIVTLLLIILLVILILRLA